MEFGSIERELYIDASPEVVFEVLTSPHHIQQWWSADTAFEPVAGETSSLTWTDEASARTHSTPFTVMQVNPPKSFSFRWTQEQGQVGRPGNSLLVSFDLVATGEGTTVRFRETGFRERGWEAAVLEAQYNDHRQGWDFYLPRLVATAQRMATA
jgi:uncharacterized protein YndB with AHSA1/START domain